MKKLLASLVLLLLLSGMTPMMPTSAQAGPTGEVVQLVNELRTARGLPPYRVDTTLTAVAQAQAEWSAANNHIGHDGPGGNRPRDRAIIGGYGGGKSISAQENAASGSLPYVTPGWVVTMWQGDDIHLGALLSANHDDIGVGYAEANGHAWYVMMIGRVGTGSLAPTRPRTEPKAPVSTSAPAAPAVPVISAQLSTPGPDGSIHHEVQSGQTAWTVAAYYGLGLQELLALNNLAEGSVLRPGDELLIRPPTAPTSTPLTPMVAQITAVAIRTQAPTILPAPSPSSAKDTTDRSTITLWMLLVVAVVVLVGSSARAVYILRR